MAHDCGMECRFSVFAEKAFPVLSVADGVVCLAQPQFLQASMTSLSL
jgi:hypothetical protein